jgi:hypothetical protein
MWDRKCVASIVKKGGKASNSNLTRCLGGRVRGDKFTEYKEWLNIFHLKENIIYFQCYFQNAFFRGNSRLNQKRN